MIEVSLSTVVVARCSSYFHPSIICTSEAAIDAYLKFGAEEARALILQHRAEVLAIAEALMAHRTLNAEQIDAIIAAAPEQARRADWAKVLENAVSFALLDRGEDRGCLSRRQA